MFSLSHDFKPDPFSVYLLASGRIIASSISTLTISCYWKRKFTVQNFKSCVIQTPLDSQSVYGCNLFQIKRVLYPSNYLNLLKALKFKQHLWLLKRQTSWHVAGNVGYCPTLPPSAIRHLRPHHVYSLHRCYTKPTEASNITHTTTNSLNRALSNVVYWTTTDIITTAQLKNFRVPAKTLISWEQRKEAVHWKQLTLPIWRQLVAGFPW
jgi:hypothetical protein